ncbi:PKD domain-containing protein [Candidatus Woesearchaeota archaeon]|nr:PKD domain-containing protein [Candidatus Woesearchaeota archaeon]
MVKKNTIFISLAIAFNFFIFVSLLSFISCSVTLGNASANQSYSISTVYSSNETLNGWLNMSIVNESTNSLIKMSLLLGDISFNKTLSLLDMLKKSVNSQVNYSCSPSDCKDFYKSSNPSISKSKTIESNEIQDNLFAFVITTPPNSLLTEIDSFTLNVTSDNDKSELPPLKIDLFNDKIIDWQSNIGTKEYGDRNYGCFEEDKAIDYATFGNTRNAYCQKMILKDSPGLMLGATVNGTKKASFNLTILNEENTRSASCLATTDGENEIFCNVTYPTFENEEYLVCVSPRDSNATEYKIKYESDNPCGISIILNELQGNLDFDIYARQEKYNTTGSFILNSSSINKINPDIISVESAIKDYVDSNYNNNCSKGCIIPINFITNKNQTINLDSLNLGFKAGVITQTNNIYDLNVVHANITTNSYQKIYLNNIGFNMPISTTSKNYTLKMYFDTRLIFSKVVSVLISNDALFWIYPLMVPVNYSTQFEIGVNNTKGINSYYWDFGDGSSPIQTTVPKASHSYSSLGNYTISVKAYDSSNKEYSKSFKVEVVSAVNALPIMLLEEESKLNKIISELNSNSMSLNNFEKSEIYRILKINENKNMISLIKSRINSSNITSNEYALYLSNLSTMNIPDSVYIKSQTQVPLPVYPQKNQIEPALIDESYNSSNLEEYQDAIYNWQTLNKKLSLTFKEINKRVDNQDYLIEKFYTLKIENQNDNILNSTLILKKYDNLIFDGNLSYNENNGYVKIDISPETRTISFATTQNVDSLNFNAIISPALSYLDVETPVPVEVKDNTKLIILISGIIVVIGIITWIILANWYKNKYEKHLFKDQNQLYNLVLFIEAERKRGKKEGEISAELKKAGWTGEQIKYASKKHANKNTGMPLSN